MIKTHTVCKEIYLEMGHNVSKSTDFIFRCEDRVGGMGLYRWWEMVQGPSEVKSPPEGQGVRGKDAGGRAADGSRSWPMFLLFWKNLD